MKIIREPTLDVEKKEKDLDITKEKYSYSVGKSANTDGNVDHAFMTFFRDIFGPLIMNPWIKVLVLLIYVGYLACAIWGCFLIELGLTEQNLVREGSKANKFLDLKYEYFRKYEPAVSVVIKTEQNYW